MAELESSVRLAELKTKNRQHSLTGDWRWPEVQFQVRPS